MSKEIRIQITASAGVGKTALATELHKYLKFRGFECYNVDVDNYEAPFDRTAEHHEQAIASIKSKDTKIIISTEQMKKSGITEKQYMVLINGREPHYADTIEETWKIIINRDLGANFQVLSPTGKDVSEFK